MSFPSSFLERHFETLGLVLMAALIAVIVLALKDEGAVEDAIAVQNGLLAVQEAGR